MAIKKTELYSSLWASCDELRGGMDASQYKNYILTLLFVKYVSDKYANQKHAPIYIPEGGSFADMAAKKGKKNIGDEIMDAVIDAFDFPEDWWVRSDEENIHNINLKKFSVQKLAHVVDIQDMTEEEFQSQEGVFKAVVKSAKSKKDKRK